MRNARAGGAPEGSGASGPASTSRPASPVDGGGASQAESSPLSSILAAVAALRLHKREPPALERALQQLSTLASSDVGCRNAAADAGGAEGVVDALRVHTASGVLRWGCAALWAMSLTLESALKVVDAGGIQARASPARRPARAALVPFLPALPLPGETPLASL